MNYDEFTPNEAAVTIVFGGTASERDAFQAAFLKKYPAFRTEMHPCLKNYKKPLLGGQKSIVNYLVKQAKKGERGLTEQRLKPMIEGSAKRLNLDHVLDRYVPALSSRQKFLFSLILEECSQVSRRALIRDDHPRLDEDDCVRIADWFARTCGNDGHIVLLAELPTEKVEGYFQLAERAAFYQLEQGRLTPFDISLAYARYKQARRQEEARPAVEAETNNFEAKLKARGGNPAKAAGDERADKEVTELALIEAAAKTGISEAQFLCGVSYDVGRGTAVDKKKALYWYEKAAQQGHAKAQCNCGMMYDDGEGTTVDKKKALYWYEKAAQQGNASAQFNCGVMYRKGEGTAVDMAKALYWYEKAAQQGDPDAQCNCGVLYYNGEGAAVDKAKAKMWLQKAAKQGHEKAKKILREYF